MDAGHLSEPVTTEGNGGALRSGRLCRAPRSMVSTESTPVTAQQSSVRAARVLPSHSRPARGRQSGLWWSERAFQQRRQPLGVGGQAGVH